MSENEGVEQESMRQASSGEQPRFVPDDWELSPALAEPQPSESESRPAPAPKPDPDDRESSALLQAPESDTWRDEVSARLSRYRARRRPRSPRYPSLRLKFDAPPASVSKPPADLVAADSHSSAVPLTCQALAMSPVEDKPLPVDAAADVVAPSPEPPQAAQFLAKILEFPRWAQGAPSSMHDLADPVIDRPRILEVPEVVTPPPAMGGITIEDTRPRAPERQPGIDMPLRSAPLGLRVWAVFVDCFVVLLACGIFGSLFYKMTAATPPLWELFILGAGLPCVFWAAYQYLFVVYCGTTPGLQAAHLRITRFDGGPVSRRRRRMRTLCSFLSGVSLGMGYAWQFLDEDRLCWHERVSRTYLSPPA